MRAQIAWALASLGKEPSWSIAPPVAVAAGVLVALGAGVDDGFGAGVAGFGVGTTSLLLVAGTAVTALSLALAVGAGLGASAVPSIGSSAALLVSIAALVSAPSLVG